jgi:hypothetical protein
LEVETSERELGVLSRSLVKGRISLDHILLSKFHAGEGELRDKLQELARFEQAEWEWKNRPKTPVRMPSPPPKIKTPEKSLIKVAPPPPPPPTEKSISNVAASNRSEKGTGTSQPELSTENLIPKKNLFNVTVQSERTTPIIDANKLERDLELKLKAQFKKKYSTRNAQETLQDQESQTDPISLEQTIRFVKQGPKPNQDVSTETDQVVILLQPAEATSQAENFKNDSKISDLTNFLGVSNQKLAVSERKNTELTLTIEKLRADGRKDLIQASYQEEERKKQAQEKALIDQLCKKFGRRVEEIHKIMDLAAKQRQVLLDLVMTLEKLKHKDIQEEFEHLLETVLNNIHAKGSNFLSNNFVNFL